MKYSEIVEQTKKELEKNYGTAAVLTQLYNKAKANYQANHNASVDALNKDYEQKKNAAAAQKMVNEKNTGEFLASRGLSYSGESAQAKLNSDISFNNTLSSLADSHSDGLTELNKKKNEYFANLDANYMENSVKARKELEQLARDMAADKIKYGDVTVNNSALGSEGGSESGDGLFDPSMSAHQLATAIVKRYGTGGKVKNAYQNLDIRNYLEGLTKRYTLADDYMDKVIFVLDALGYTAADEQGLYTQISLKTPIPFTMPPTEKQQPWHSFCLTITMTARPMRKSVRIWKDWTTSIPDAKVWSNFTKRARCLIWIPRKPKRILIT